MERNKNLVHAILKLVAESQETSVTIFYEKLGGYSQKQVINHMLLMKDSNLVELKDYVEGDSSKVYPAKVRITWKGHDWLEEYEDEVIKGQAISAQLK